MTPDGSALVCTLPDVSGGPQRVRVFPSGAFNLESAGIGEAVYQPWLGDSHEIGLAPWIASLRDTEPHAVNLARRGGILQYRISLERIEPSSGGSFGGQLIELSGQGFKSDFQAKEIPAVLSSIPFEAVLTNGSLIVGRTLRRYSSTESSYSVSSEGAQYISERSEDAVYLEPWVYIRSRDAPMVPPSRIIVSKSLSDGSFTTEGGVKEAADGAIATGAQVGDPRLSDSDGVLISFSELGLIDPSQERSRCLSMGFLAKVLPQWSAKAAAIPPGVLEMSPSALIIAPMVLE